MVDTQPLFFAVSISPHRLSAALGFVILGLVAASMLGGTLWLYHRRYRLRHVTAEEFLVAGRSVSSMRITTSIVCSWTWAATIMVSARVGYEYGLSGPLWYAAGASFQLALFAVLAGRIRRRMPLSYTYLEFLRFRYGRVVHLIFVGYAILTNTLVTVMIVLGGVLATVTVAGTNPYAVAFLIPLGFTCYTMVGGLWASIVTDQFQLIGIIAGVLVLSALMLSRVNSAGLFQALSSVPGSGGNLLLFSSGPGVVFGFINALSNTSTVFADQTYWVRALASRTPSSAVRSFVSASALWFPIPLVAGLMLGTTARVLVVPPQNPDVVSVLASAELAGGVGSFLILLVILMAVLSTGDSEASGIAPIASIDVYKTYVDRNADDRRVIQVARVSILLFGLATTVITWGILALDLSMWWLFSMIGVLVGPSVVPLTLSFLWVRGRRLTTALALPVGTAAGLFVWWRVGAAAGLGWAGLRSEAPLAMALGNAAAYGASTLVFLWGAASTRESFDFSWLKPGLPVYCQSKQGEPPGGADL
ncbi:MAG: sodium:solute symporter family protein [Thermoleophilia bacterium]|nr:sodium:solute symporter family protein [Thermoleophilia bacterium]